MPPGDPPGDPVRRFAAELAGLKIGPDSGEAETRSALFRKLRNDDFLPDPLGHEAILALAGRPVSPVGLLAEALGRAEERRRHLEVEEYAARFFDEPVASRTDRYRLLGLACADHPRLIERLRSLRPGLPIDRPSVDDPSPLVKRLLDDFLVLFPMGLEARAREARRRAQRFRSDPDLTDADRAKVLKGLAKRHPEILALVPDYRSRLGRERREFSGATVEAKLRGLLNLRVERRPRLYLFLALMFLGQVTHCAVNNPFAPRNRESPAVAPAFPPPVVILPAKKGLVPPASRPGQADRP